MGDEGADQDAISLKQKARMEAVPGDSGCICSHKYNEGEVFYNTCNVVFEAFPGDVKVEKTANHQHYEIYDEAFVVVALVNEPYI